MNGQLPPVDPDLRTQLARRAAGRAPDELLAGVSAAIDSAAASRASFGRAWPVWRAPRLLGAGIGLALVAIIAVAVALPAFRPGPAGTPAAYPADRALTTAELAALMAGPAMAPNTALVASVTIASRRDVCPMNRYPTIGVIEGMGSQVCVMGAGVSQYLTEAKVSGTFAFRYLAPGYLGLLGQITPASNTKVSFAASGDWPSQGKAFLVAGWLGAYPVSCPTVTPDQLSPGDPLNPNDADPCAVSWLTDDPNAVPTVAGNGLVPPAGGRFVQAGGARVIDNIDGASPVRGVYVVRGGLVLARLADLSTLSPSPLLTGASTPTPTTAPPATPIAEPTTSVGPPAPALTGLIGPGNRALTPAEVSALVAADPNGLVGRYVIDKRPSCQKTCGATQSVFADYVTPGWTVGQGEDGELVNLAIDGIVWTLPQAIGAVSRTPGLFVLDAWISGAGEDSCDVVGQPCYEVSWLGSTAGANEMKVQLGAYHEFGAGAVGGGPAIHGLFLISSIPDKACGLAPCPGQARILARLESVSP